MLNPNVNTLKLNAITAATVVPIKMIAADQAVLISHETKIPTTTMRHLNFEQIGIVAFTAATVVS